MRYKVTQILSSPDGGAGRAAMRIIDGIKDTGLNFEILTRTNHDPSSNITQVKVGSPWIEKITRFTGVKKPLFSNLEYLSKGKTDYDILPLINGDLIHLHWVANFLDWRSFFSENKKPVIWTLHDMNPFQGIFHYKMGVQKHPNLVQYDQKVSQYKKQCFSKRKSPVAIVSPSRWLLEASKESEIFGQLSHYHIPYGVPLDTFYPLNHLECKSVLGINERAPTLLFVSQSLDDYRKGFQQVESILPNLVKSGVQIITVGYFTRKLPGVKSFGYVVNSDLLRVIYNAADIFLLPSLEDNLPNTMLESLACGRPIISHQVGGMLDHVINGRTGYLTEETSAAGLLQAVNKWLSFWSPQNNFGQFDPSVIRDYAVAQFNTEQRTKEYLNVYQSLLDEVPLNQIFAH